MDYRLTDWEQLKDQDAVVRHLVHVGDEDMDEVIATFAQSDLGARIADAALALANGDVALTVRITADEHTVDLIVNGQPFQVPCRSADDVGAVTARALRMARYRAYLPWEAKDEHGVVLATTDDPARLRHIALRAGTAS